MYNIEYQIVRTHPFKRTTTISISPEGGVVVRAPSWVPHREIERFVKLKSGWIKKQLDRFFNSPKPQTKNFVHGEYHPLFGQEYPLLVNRLPYINRCRLKFIDNTFRAVVPESHSPTRQKKELTDLMLKLYLEHGKKIINEKVFHYSKVLSVSYNRITLKKVSSIWGSCSRQNNLNFNRKLVMAPHPVVDYVVIHEVCHLVHRHHRKDFWSLVRSLCPDYKDHVRWLKSNHHLLTI